MELVRPSVDRGARPRSASRYHAVPVATSRNAARPRRRRAIAGLVAFGVVGGVGVVGLKLAEYRFLVVEHSVEIYVGLVAALFAGVGIWLGRTLRRRAPATGPAETQEPFVVDESRVAELGITPRELETLGLIATGLSNREIADRLCVSENTVKTHCSRLFDKLGARRRTQAVQIGRASGLIP